MGYWREMYGTQSQEFIDGAKAAADAYAIWRDGKPMVGSPEKLLKDVLEEIQRDLSGKDEEDTP